VSRWEEVDVDGRRASELTRLPDGLLRIERCRPHQLPRSWALAVGAAWPLLFVVMVALAPEPTDPNAVASPLESAVFFAITTGLLGTVITAGTRRTDALVWSTCLGVVWVATTIACPLTGHHDVTWQWYVELTSSASLLLLSVLGLRALRTR
jgi:hypothetical protein